MKLKHNKKRNTAFLYEVLIKEYTKAVVRKDNKLKRQILTILKEHFTAGRVLKQDLDLYNIILESKDMSSESSKRLVSEVKKDFDLIDRKVVFNSQTKLIKQINETIGKEAFANFISNYKSIATVGQYFANNNSAKQRILLEDNVVKLMSSRPQETKSLKHIDKLTYNTFVGKFNETYQHTLREEQKNLLTKYITSFSDNGLGLKVFMNEEVGRLKTCVKENISNNLYPTRFGEILNKLENIKKSPITETTVREIFYIQDLLHEVQKNGS
jgi:hypothetical protein